MSLTTFLTTVVPLIVFVIVDIKAGMRTAITTAILLGLALFFWFWHKTGEFDVFGLVEIGLLIALGVVSIKMKNSRFFKFQPTVVGCIIALYFAYMQLFAEPLLVHMRPMIVALNPETTQNLMTPQMTTLLTKMSLHLIPVFAIHAGLVAFAALKLSNIAWIVTRLLIYPLMLGVAVLDMVANKS